MTDHPTENARLRAALDEREADMLEWLYKISHPTLAQYPRSMARNYAERLRREMAERADIATPAYDTRADWLWYGIDTDNRTHVTFGRWPRLPCQKRYKLADIQPVEHDHPAPAPDAVQEAARTRLLEKALKVAMGYLAPHQPDDSSAVDDWFLACAAVQAELDDTDGWIEQCLDAAIRARGEVVCDEGHSCPNGPHGVCCGQASRARGEE